MVARKTPVRRKKTVRRNVRLRPANPFDLIRLIAHSQSDPRKAMAELVQNSLDAGAERITVTRRRLGGEQVISIFDDGHGVFPQMERPEALEHVASNIGHSFKGNLSAVERQRQMMIGKYGIGILGFWAVGRELEMRTRVGASDVWRLRLLRGEPLAEVKKDAQRRMGFSGDTFTEVLIRGIHPDASRQLSGRRLGEYLGSELRGQLLSRAVKLRMIDRIATGKAMKDFLVVPHRFQGRLLKDFREVPVAGFPPATVELYIAPEKENAHRAAVAIQCGGTTVCDDLAALEGYELDARIWGSGSLEGIVDFPALEVAPSTRRGFTPGPAAEAFFAALRASEPRLLEILDREQERRRLEEEEDLAKEIRKVFRPLAQSLPQYDFLRFSSPDDASGSPRDRSRGASIGHTDELDPVDPTSDSPDSEVLEVGDDGDAAPEILPPGPLHDVRLSPRRCRLLPGASRSLHAKARDEGGRPVTEGVRFSWRLAQGEATLAANGAAAEIKAGERTSVARVEVEARQGERAARADAEVQVVETLKGESPDAGIPDPKRVFDREGNWRSRVVDGRWEYNAAHPDYHAVADDPRRRLRYFVHLFAKEIVLRNYGEPQEQRSLERMVEVLTYVRPR